MIVAKNTETAISDKGCQDTASGPILSADGVRPAKKQIAERIRRHGFLPHWKAIRAKCMDCAGADGSNWVRDCHITDCALWPYRMGRRPREEDLLVAVIDRSGRVTERRPYGARG